MAARARTRLAFPNRGGAGNALGGDRLHLRSTKGAARRATLGAQGSGGTCRSGVVRLAPAMRECVLPGGEISGYFIGLGPLFSR